MKRRRKKEGYRIRILEGYGREYDKSMDMDMTMR
jgi:hypothetical protein